MQGFIRYSLTQNLVFVDGTNGSSSGAIHDPSKPFDTIQNAISAASSGDTVVVLPGSYSGTITLQDGVNVDCYPGVTITGIIKDSSSKVVCEWTGYAKVNSTSSNAIDFRGVDTDVKFYFTEAKTTGNQLVILNPGANSLNFYLESNYIEAGKNIGTFRGGSNSVFNIKGMTECPGTSTGDAAVLDCRNSFIGSVKYHSKNFNSANITTTGYFWPIYAFDLGANAKIDMTGYELTYLNPTNASSESNGTLFRQTDTANADSEIRVSIKKIKTVTRSLMVTTGTGVDTEKFMFEDVNFESENNYSIRPARENTNHLFKRCNFKRGDGGSDENIIMVVGQVTPVIADIGTGANNFNVDLEDCTVKKVSQDTDNVKAICYTSGTTSNVSVNGCKVVGEGMTTSYAFSSETDITTGKIYFGPKPTVSNLDTEAGLIQDTATVSGFIANDTNVKILD